jgi:aquaporin Z
MLDTLTSPEVTPVETAPSTSWQDSARKYAVEFIGTFFLVFTVAAAVFGGSPLAPLAIGMILMVMIYAGGHISGGHYNPAVTLAALVRGRIDLRNSLGYWGAQLLGGAAGAVLAGWLVNPASFTIAPLTGRALVAAAIAEALFTFVLAYVVLNVATSKDHPDNSFYGLATGFTVAAGAFVLGGISGAAFNPAVILGSALLGLFAWTTVGIYMAVQLVAGALAGLVFLLLNPEDH